MFCNLIGAVIDFLTLCGKNVSQNPSHVSKISYQNYEEPGIDTEVSVSVRLSVISKHFFLAMGCCSYLLYDCIHVALKWLSSVFSLKRLKKAESVLVHRDFSSYSGTFNDECLHPYVTRHHWWRGSQLWLAIIISFWNNPNADNARDVVDTIESHTVRASKDCSARSCHTT